MSDIDPRVLADVVVLLHEYDDAQIFERRTVMISPAKVLAWVWRQDRFDRCAERLAAGEKAPPISVARYILNGETWYVVGDGHHRTIAALAAGRTRIRARIGSEVVCHPERYRLDTVKRKLWRETKDRRWLEQIASDLSDETMAALVAVGVKG